jgi:small subunit ribosomal protein S4
LLILLESRLDNVVFRMGMAPTRDAAKQLITHGHLKVNGRRVNIPSVTLRGNDELSIKDSSKSKALVQRYIEENSDRELPEWVSVDNEQLSGKLLRPPLRTEIMSVANEQLIVELYSK